MWYRSLVKLCLIWVILFTEEVYASPFVINLPKRNPHFVGRSNFFQEIDRQTLNSEIVILSGYSGMGKSQIVKEYAYQALNQYDVIWWFHGKQYMEPQLKNLAHDLNRSLNLKWETIDSIGSEKLSNMALHAFDSNNLKVLLIFDDFKANSEIEWVLSDANKMDLIVTTQNSGFAKGMNPVGAFEPGESIEFLANVFPSESHHNLRSLAEHLKHNPSSLALASEYIQQYPGMKVESYVEKFESISPRLGQKQMLGDTTDAYQSDIFTATQLNIQALQEKSKQAYALLNFLALCQKDGVSMDTIHAWLDLNSIPHQEVVKLLNDMKDYSLIEINGEKVGMHELVQRIVTELMTDEKKMERIDQAVAILTDKFSGRSDFVSESMLKDPEPLLHAKRVLKVADEMGYQSVEISILRTYVFDVLTCGMRDLEGAQAMSKQLEKDMLSGIILPVENDILYNITRSVFSGMNTSDYGDALFYAEKAQKLLETQPAMFEEKIRLIANFIQYSSLRGELDKCQPLIEKGQILLSKSESAAYNALFIFATTLVLIDQGKPQEAIDLIIANEELMENLELYPSIKFYILNQLAEAYLKKNDPTSCLQALNESKSLAEEFYADDQNTFFGNLYVLQAYAHLSDKDLLKASKVIDRALGIYKAVIKEDDFQRGQALGYLVSGKILQEQSKFHEAQGMLNKSEEVYSKALNHQVVDDLSDLYSSIAILGIDLKDDALTHSYLNKHTDLFGLNHPRTRKIMTALDKSGLSL